MERMDDEFYLCQPEPRGDSIPSCAACCGIYNYPGHSRALVTEVLALQTELMAGWDGTDADIERVRSEAEARRPAPRFEVLYNCPFCGFLDPARARVGCLLHPRRLGRDRRDFCRFGHRTCAEARCASYTYLDRGEAEATMAAAGDWYLYGLALNDTDLIKDFFDLCERRLYGPVDPARVPADPALAAAFRDYLRLKEDWPLARDPGRFGKYFFQGRNYNVYLIDYLRLGVPRPPHDDIVTALGSVIETREELDRAVRTIDERIDAFVGLYGNGGRG
jgi:hypothetical protein